MQAAGDVAMAGRDDSAAPQGRSGQDEGFYDSFSVRVPSFVQSIARAYCLSIVFESHACMIAPFAVSFAV